MHPPTFGIKTVPAHTTYDDLLRVWREADEIPEIEHIWLWDHLVPLFGPVDGPILEGWTLLSALAARTERVQLGLMVTSNRLRPPAVLAKMAATVDVIANGRLVMGIGVGGTRQPGDEFVPREYGAYGIPVVSPRDGVDSLDESIRLMRRLWTETGPFDFAGRHYQLVGAVGEPKPVRPGGPPLLVGGWGDRTLRVVATHADIWNIPGPPHNPVEHIAERNRRLDAICAEIGRDPAAIRRSTQLIAAYDDPAATRATVRRLVDAGIDHVVVNLLMPFPAGVARWVADEIIVPVSARAR